MRQAGAARFAPVLSRSPLPGVADAAWAAYERVMSAHPVRWRSVGGAIGAFEMRPRRLGEIGVMGNLRRGAGGLWEGDLLPGYEDLGESLGRQREVHALSTRLHDERLAAGRCPRPAGASRSGCLVILHCGGEGALRMWPEGAFKTTRALFDGANGIF